LVSLVARWRAHRSRCLQVLASGCLRAAIVMPAGPRANQPGGQRKWIVIADGGTGWGVACYQPRRRDRACRPVSNGSLPSSWRGPRWHPPAGQP